MKVCNIYRYNIEFYRTWKNFRIYIDKPDMFWLVMQKDGTGCGQLEIVHIKELRQ